MENGSTLLKEKFYHDLIESIVAALEARDIYTANHSRRVSDLAERLCKFLGINDNDTQTIHIAADVHDIGKIGIPDNILLKAGKLTDEEWVVMKSHPNIGANILLKSQNLESVTKMVLHHHERYDGKGYPIGLSGEDIPLGARIIAICDSIDAMLNERAYRKPLSINECKNEIEKNIEIMYDPDIAKCVLKNWDEIVFI